MNKCCYYFLFEHITTQALFHPTQISLEVALDPARGQCGSFGLDNITWLEVISILFRLSDCEVMSCKLIKLGSTQYFFGTTPGVTPRAPDITLIAFHSSLKHMGLLLLVTFVDSAKLIFCDAWTNEQMDSRQSCLPK